MAVPRDNSKFLRNLPLVRFNEEPRGYSKSEVDRVLQNIVPIADSIEDLQAKLRSTEERAVQAEGRAASAEARLSEAEAEAARLTTALAAKPADAVASPLTSPVVTNAPEPASSTPEPAFKAAAAPSEPPVDHAFDETLRKTLLLAQRTADATVADAEAEAASLLAAAEVEASTVLGSAKDEADTMLSTTRAEHDALASSIEAERAQRLDELNAEILAKRAELQADLETNEAAERDRLVAEVADLTEMRDLLARDIHNFEEHLGARREGLSAALRSLTDLADNTDGLDPVDAPEPTNSTGFDPDDFEAVAVAAPSGVDEPGFADSPAGDPAESSSEGFLFGEPPSSDGDSTQMFEVVLTDEVNDNTQVEVESVEFDAFAGADVERATSSDTADGPAADGPAADAATGETPVAGEGAARPAWADAVPPEQSDPSVDKDQSGGATDPFLDQLRRATGEDEAVVLDDNDDVADAEAEALSRFLDNDDQSSAKTGWFGRRK